LSKGILDSSVAKQAFEILLPLIKETLKNRCKRQHLAIVVSATIAINTDHKIGFSTFKKECYLIESIGDHSEWEHDYTKIALSKAEKSARTGKSTAELAPHYLIRSDTIYWGSVVIDDIVVACSGVEPYYDEMFSGWIAITIKALCKEDFVRLPNGTNFIE